MDAAATTSGRAVDCDDDPVPVRDEGYVDALVRASLHLIRKDFPHDVRGHGVRLIQHLVRFRWEELSITNWSKFVDVVSFLGVELRVPDDLVWKNATAHLVAEVVWSHGISLLHDLIPCFVCLSAKGATETLEVLMGHALELLEKHSGAVSGENLNHQVEVTTQHACAVKAALDAANAYAQWVDVIDLAKHGLIKGCGRILICNDFHRPMTIGIFDTDKYYDGDCAHAGHGNYSRDNILEDSEPRMLGNDGARQANSFHQRYKDVLTCILSPLSKIWTQPEWEGKYTHYAWCLTHLFSDRRFVKNVYDVVKSWEEQFKRRVDESHVIQIPDKYSDSLLQLILPLLLQFLRCVHALWNQEITFDLSEELTKAKRSGIDEEEGSQEIEMRQWLQDIRESGLRMSFFGYLVDGEAAMKAIPFCHALVHLARAANDDKLRDSVKKEKESEDVADSFKCWLVKQKEDLRAKAYSAPPKEFFEQTQLEWNWEFQDEFRRYLPVYFEMMQEVDAMVGCLEVDYLYREVLYMKLRPEFRSKYAIDSSEHPHLKIISNMRERKYYSMVSAKHHKQIYAILGDLITLKPYIKGSDHSYEIVERIGEKFEIPSNIFDCDDAEKSIHGHKDFLLEIVRQLAKAKAAEYSEPFVPQMEDFKPHLQPYAAAFFEATLKDSMYDNAKVQVHLHEEFDSYLSSGELDGHLQQSLKDIDAAVPSPFSILQKDLIDLSLKLKDEVKSLMSELEAEGFFDVDDKQIEWEKKYFSESIDRFNDKVFAGHSLPRHYVIRGIMDYRTILFWKANSWEDAFDKLWSDTRYYDHQYYDIIREPFKQMLV
uniref:Exportin-5 C-terminal domain-containing protein n=1 Tax=Leersia perrieri TaxID=77586 RepID=A0A0D9XSF8_9ORYZ